MTWRSPIRYSLAGVASIQFWSAATQGTEFLPFGSWQWGRLDDVFDEALIGPSNDGSHQARGDGVTLQLGELLVERVHDSSEMTGGDVAGYLILKEMAGGPGLDCGADIAEDAH